MRQERVAEALRRLEYDPLIDSWGRLSFLKPCEDGTRAIHYLERARDIDGETWEAILRELPDLRRTLLRADVFEAMRAEAILYRGSRPWDVVPLPEEIPTYNARDFGGIFPLNSSGYAADPVPPIHQLLVSSILARQAHHQTRVAIAVILCPRPYWPAVLANLCRLCADRVHEDAPGHGQPSPDALVTVYHEPPKDDDTGSRLWMEARGDKRWPVSLPVVLTDPQDWSAWEAWFRACRHTRKQISDQSRPVVTLPPLWPYVVERRPASMSHYACEYIWSGALALRDQIGLPAMRSRWPSPAPYTSGIPRRIRNKINECREWDDLAREAADPPGSVEARVGSKPEGRPPD